MVTITCPNCEIAVVNPGEPCLRCGHLEGIGENTQEELTRLREELRVARNRIESLEYESLKLMEENSELRRENAALREEVQGELGN